MNIKTNFQCILCGSNNSKVICKIKERIFRKENFEVLKCIQCGVAYTNPCPSQKDIVKYYPDDYYSFVSYSPVPFIPSCGNILKRLKIFLKKCVLKENYGYPFNNYPKSYIFRYFLRFLAIVFKFQIGWVFPPYIKNGKILDVGCGTGIFLTKLKELKYETYGVEQSKEAAEWAKNKLGLNVFAGTLESVKFPSEFFDVVNFSHVFEHLYDPLRTLHEVYRILKPRGIIMIDIPNIKSLERRIFGKHWLGWDPPRHLFHFSPDTIEKMLRKAKFSLVKIESPSDPRSVIPSLPFFLDFLTNKRDTFVRNLFDADKNFVLRIFLLPIAFSLALIKQIGRMVIVGRKE